MGSKHRPEGIWSSAGAEGFDGSRVSGPKLEFGSWEAEMGG
jgi:hypothetical protein